MNQYKNKRTLSPEKIIFSIWGIFILYMLIRQHADISDCLNAMAGHTRLLELLVIIMISAENYFFIKFSGNYTNMQKSILLFSIAMTVRIGVLPFFEYIPTNDFENYFNGALHFAENGFKGGVYDPLLSYGIPSFAGQAVINGLLLRILSPTLLGFQILNCLYTSGICVMIYLLGQEVNSRAALFGAVFYTFYPSNILSAQITTPHHGATFFMLLGLYFYSSGFKTAGIKRKVFLFLSSALCLAISNFYHPSAAIIICAITAHALLFTLHEAVKSPQKFFYFIKNEIKNGRDMLLPAFAVILVYAVIFNISIFLMTESGYYTGTIRLPNIYKIVVGFNFDTKGGWNAEDYTYMMEPSSEEATAKGLKRIQERLSEHSRTEILELMIEKTDNVWFKTDNYFGFHIDGKQQRINNTDSSAVPSVHMFYKEKWEQYQSLMNEICTVDNLFVYGMWMLALAGLFYVLFTAISSILNLLIYIPLGWMLFIMISEAQSRYRYPAMSIIILLAGCGLYVIQSSWMPYIRKSLRHILFTRKK